MFFSCWLDAMKSKLTSPPKRASSRATRRSQWGVGGSRVEHLEDRQLLTLLTAASYPTGSGPVAVVSADFNNDSVLDLATTDLSGSTVSVLLGNPGGTFQAAQSSATGDSPRSLAVGDFNEDGMLDLVTTNANNISVLLGNGNGTFGAPANINLDSTPASVAVGDFNSDGQLDLAATGNIYVDDGYGYYGGHYYHYESSTSVLLGNGSGSFAAPTPSLPRVYGYRVAAVEADFNGDTRLDLAVVESGGSVTLLLGTGTGTFVAQNYLYAGPAGALTAADVNSDGKLDLCMASSQSVSVMLGNGLGGLGTAQYYSTGSQTNSVAVSDFNGDGKADLVTANANGTVSVLLGPGTGVFRPSVTIDAGLGTTWLGGLSVGDFDGDGRPDVAATAANSDNLLVLLNDANWPALNAPLITVSDVTLTEGNTGSTIATLTVSLSAAYGLPVSFRYTTEDGTATLAGNDYVAASGTLTIDAGQTSQTFTVTINGDRLAEPYSESFSVRLTSPTNAFLADGTGVVTIADDEPYVSIDSYFSHLEGNTGSTPFTFTVTLSSEYDAPVTVAYSTADLTLDDEYWYGPGATAGVDYMATSGTLTFAAGVTSMTFIVPVIGDRVGEFTELFFVNLSNPVNAILSASQSLGAIEDNEPTVSISNYVSVVEGNSGTQPVTFSVTLSAASDAPVTVDFTTVDSSATSAGGDYQAQTGSLTFMPGGSLTQNITVLINGDQLGEYDETFSVNLTGATGATISAGTGIGVILDNEPRLNVNSVSVVEGNRGTKLMTFTVTLSAISNQTVTVKYATNDWTATAGEDYVATSGTLTFNPGQTTKTFTVTIKGDKKKEPDERFFISLSDASSNSLIENYSGTGNILTDEGGRASVRRQVSRQGGGRGNGSRRR